MFCDLVGSTAISTRLDPEDLREVIRAYQDACSGAIARYDGFVAKFMGDGILAYFGYPRAHEDDAERAVRAALEIAAAVAKLETLAEDRLEVRIGIATGLVVVGDLIGQGSAQEQSVVGDTPNLAARLQGVAEPGSIVVSEQVRRLVGGSFDYEDLGEMTLKGFAQPTHGYRILGASETVSRFEAATQEGLTPLVGRDQEIALLLERWQLAQDGEGQVVLLSGEPGIGKSRILSGLRGRLEGVGAQAIRFQCSPYYVNSAFWPIIDNFERMLKFGRDEQSQSKLDKLEALIVNDHGRPLGDVRFVASMLSVPCEERYGASALTAQKHKDETLRVLVEMTSAIAHKQASVMLFEDAHWADPTTLEVLDLLIDRIGTVPLLIVLTHRPEFHPKWTGHGHVSALNLSKLTRAQSSAMVSEVAGGKTLPPGLVEQIATRTDGVPLFVEELTKSILESGELQEVGDRYDYIGSGRGITIPATLRDSLMARLDRFAPVKEIAQIGAAIGREFSYELIEAVWSQDKNELGTALQQLTDSGLAFRRGTLPETTYTFKHALVRDAAYDSLLKTRKQELHAKIARALEERLPANTEAAVLAHHYTQAGIPERASAHWLTAGRAALGRAALTEAVRQLRVGLEQADCLPAGSMRDRRELDTQLCLGNALMQAKGIAAPEADVAFKRAYALRSTLGRSSELIPILFGICAVRLIGGQPRAALEIVDEMVPLAQGNRQAELVVKTLLMDAHFWLGNFVIADGYFVEAMNLYDDEQDGQLIKAYAFDMKILNLVYASHFQWMRGFPERALRTKELLDRSVERLGNPFMSAQAAIWGAGAFHYCGRLDKHRSQVLKGLEISTQIGFPFFERQAEIWYAWNRVQTNDLSVENLALFERALSGLVGVGTGCLMPYFTALRAEALAKQGALVEAQDLLRDALDRVDAFGEESHAAEIHRIRAVILLRDAVSRHEVAEQELLASLAIARRQVAKSWELRTSISLARLWQAQGKRKEAHELLTPIYNWFTEGFETRDLKEAKALLDKLA